jgi:2-polyprenyl-3-methyl-5-hydroxy-6-metoxy-1,4-benzoquinol methylase
MNEGERVTHLYPNDSYFAHLSIYAFAVDYCRDGQVLDAGCGAGYGSAYLVDHGAKHVTGVDCSRYAIDFCKKQFSRSNLEFKRMDIADITGLPEKSYDLIFASNVMEHVDNLASFLDAAARLLKSQGSLIVAVPPVMDQARLESDTSNPHHLHHMTPNRWKALLASYFEDTECFAHICTRNDVMLDFANKPAQCKIDEYDFSFHSCTLDEIVALGSLTTLFVARKPR